MEPLTTIDFNQHVIVRLPSKNYKIVELKPNTSISLGKFGAFEVNDIIGYPFGLTFEIFYDNEDSTAVEKTDSKSKNKIPIGKVRLLSQEVEDESNDKDDSHSEPPLSTKEKSVSVELSNINSSATNQNLVNMGSKAQELTIGEIEQMKQESLSSKEIIDKIIKSHKSFHNKTVYSQEKYLNRKKQKFAKYFTVEYLSSSNLLQFLIDKGDIQRILDMSQESMGMLLNLGNIQPNGNYLCMDETGGLLVYFLMERMFGGDNESKSKGKIVVIHENEHANLDLLKFANYSEKFIKEHVHTISLLDFFEPPTLEEIQERFTPLPKEEARALKGGKKNSYYRRLRWYNTQLQVMDLTGKFLYDGLVVATTLHLPTVVPKLAEKVHGSRPIVCYGQFKETLLELAHTLYSDLRFLAPSILEVRCRPYQSIRGKLHPLMTMKGGGGYLMWCHKVIPAPEPISEATVEVESTSAAIGEHDAKKQKV
ncbi:tRNA 1-methyladenosine methyltransferase subunit GCD10 [Saccharomyces eubayanus]|uniref:tRNA 1-methyladenosine methyltransferase subunit GCD10 n=1 Tax=Saccharomyces eubayanus TaxID=1080349 RepID=UPI0006C0AFDC|nr:GCD10-like protein [Saccharomyces eubayanus]KOG97095.1 GCD10-like protein [Saccharomyces eubayanus]